MAGGPQQFTVLFHFNLKWKHTGLTQAPIQCQEHPFSTDLSFQAFTAQGRERSCPGLL